MAYVKMYDDAERIPRCDGCHREPSQSEQDSIVQHDNVFVIIKVTGLSISALHVTGGDISGDGGVKKCFIPSSLVSFSPSTKESTLW